MKFEYFTDPIPYLYISEIVPKDIYDKIKFPDLKPGKDRRATRGLFRGDENYSEIMKSEGWRDVFQAFNFPDSIKKIVNLFSKDIKKYKCEVEVEKIYFKDYVESYEEVMKKKIDDKSDPNALFTRLDFQAADTTYDKKVHCDHVRRLIGGVLFFSDYKEEKLEGGKFAIYKDGKFNDDRICHEPILVKEIPVIHNTGALFLNSNEGFHGATEITSIEGWRKWIYYSISSKRNIWPSKTATISSKVFRKIKRFGK